MHSPQLSSTSMEGDAFASFSVKPGTTVVYGWHCDDKGSKGDEITDIRLARKLLQHHPENIIVNSDLKIKLD